MKKTMLKIAVPTLAIGLAFAPAANATTSVSVKTEVSVKTDAKEVKKLSAKEKEAIKKLASINKNISKVDTNVKQLSTATTNFYAKAATSPLSVKSEASFFTSTSGKLKAHTYQLKALKIQVDLVAKKYKGTDAVAAAYKQITDLNAAITVANKNLTDLHKQFLAPIKAEEAKKQFEAITLNLTKVETNVAELSKATTDFYVKATTDATITAKVEAEFFKTTSTKLTANTNQLNSMKKQLDTLAKDYKEVDYAASYKKIIDLNASISVTNNNLKDLHNKFLVAETQKQVALITNELSKVEVNIAELSKGTTDFYAKAATDATVTAKVEVEFFKTTSSKLIATKNQLNTMKKQLDSLAKYNKQADLAASYKKVADLNTAISTTNKNLTDLHNKFLAALKAEEVKKQLASITTDLSKVETNVATLSKATTDFYAKAATDATITAKVEAEFYKNTSASLLTNTKHLLNIKKQLDSFVKNHGSSDEVKAVYTKISAQNKSILTAVEVLTNLHINFKPATPPTTN